MIKLEHLYSFIESNFDYLLAVTHDHRVLYANPQLHRLLARGAEVLEGRLLEDILTPASFESFRQASDRAAEGNRSTVRLTPKSEPVSLVLLRSTRVEAARGLVYLFIGSEVNSRSEDALRLLDLEREIESRTRDFEDQHHRLSTIDACLAQTTRDWERSTARLETLFKAIPDEVALIDDDRNLVMTNRAGVEPGQKCYETFFGRDVPCDDCHLSKIIRSKAPTSTTIRFGDRYLQVHANPVFSQEHEVEAIVEFHRDVTLEKSYEQQIRQADKLAALGQLVSGIGHEINNPNQFIRGNIKIVRQAMEDILPIVDAYYENHPDLRVARLKYDFFRRHFMTLVDDMAHGSERIKQIVDALRGFVRHDDGLLVDQVEINTLVEATTRLVENEVHKHAVICLDLGENIPRLIGNSQKIEQVLVNLLVNASEAMDEDKRGRITVRTWSDGDNVAIQVEDNGRGMNEKTVNQIFDPFFTTKRGKGGTGLGLAISYRIITEHGGTISAASTPGGGTIFTINLPVAPAKQ
jgi:signal transduction histidine kinase/PAS domain-containing protein